MAQIIKYANGGSASKYGTFTKDGIVYDNIDDNFLTQLQHYSPEAADALRSGKDISYNSETNTILGDVDFGLKESQDKKLERKGRLLEGSRVRRARQHISNLSQFNPTSNTTPIQTTELDLTDTINLDYGEKDSLGNRQLLSSADNDKARQRINRLLNLSNADFDSYKFYGNKFANKDEAIRYIDSVRDVLSSNEFQSRLANGQLNENDLSILNSVGIFDNRSEQPQTEEQLQQEQEDKLRTDWGKWNWDYDKWKHLINVDTGTGDVTISDPEFAAAIGTGNIWLNDEWKEINGAYADYIPDNSGLFLINGKLYRGDDLERLRKNQTFLNWVKENRETGGNSTLIKQYHTPGTVSRWSSFSSDSAGNPIWSPFFKSNQFGRDASGEYERFEGDPLIIDYFPDYNSENLDMFDPYGHPLQSLAQRVYIDPKTKQVVENYRPVLREQTNNAAVKAYYANENRPTAFNSYFSLGGNGGYQEVANSGDYGNTGVGASLYYNPQTNMYYWYDMNPGGSDMTINSKLPKGQDSMGTYAWNIDKRLGDYLRAHPEVLTNSRVRDAINDIIQNVYLTYNSQRRNDPAYLQDYPELTKILRELNISQVLGNDQRTYHGWRGNRDIRRITSPTELAQRGLAYQIPVNKKGGIIKHQIGGVASNRTASIRGTRTVRESDHKQRAAGVDKVIGDGTRLNASDKAELAALVADAASLGATFVPVYGNALGAGFGAASSLTSFGADIARDGLDLGDFGNLAINLGLDLATLIPGLGTAGKATKIAKAMKKSGALAKWIGNTISAGAGVAGLATAWSNIQDGSWTIKDIRTILNGLRGFSNLKRTTGSATKKGAFSDKVTLKPVSNKELPEIKLKKSEIEAVEVLPKGKRSEKLQDIIIGKLGKAKTDNVTNILDEYGIKEATTRGFNWRKPWNWNKGTNVNTGQFKFDRQADVYRNPAEMGWYNWHRRAAIRDAKTNRLNPYFKDYAIPVTSTVNGTTINAFRRAPVSQPIYGGLMLDYGVFNDTAERRSYYDVANPPVFYKKGGKVIKGQTGVTVPGFTKKDTPKSVLTNFTKQFNDDFGDVLGEANFIGTSNSGITPQKQVGSIATPELLQNFDKSISIPKLQDSKVRTLTKSKLFGTRPKDENPRSGDSFALDHINPDMIMGLSDFIVSSRAINRSADKMKEAIRKGIIGSQQQMPTELYPTFTDNGLHRMADQRLNNIRKFKTVTSDSKEALVERLMRDAMADQIAAERNTKFSQAIDNYRNKTLELKQQYADQRRQIADSNRNKWAQGEAQLAMNEANRIGQQAQNWKNLIYQTRQNHARDLAGRNAIEEKLLTANAQIQYQNELKKLFDAKGGFNAMSEDHKRQYGNDWMSYMQNVFTPESLNLQNKYLFNAYKSSLNNPWTRYGWFNTTGDLDIEPIQLMTSTLPQTSRSITREKKGGRIQRFRNVGEQHYLDQQKAINKAVNDLNNNIIKLFTKMMS